MTRQRRYPLLLELGYPPERAVVELLMALPDGERTAFLRACVLVGHRELLDEQRSRQDARADAEMPREGGSNG